MRFFLCWFLLLSLLSLYFFLPSLASGEFKNGAGNPSDFSLLTELEPSSSSVSLLNSTSSPPLSIVIYHGIKCKKCKTILQQFSTKALHDKLKSVKNFSYQILHANITKYPEFIEEFHIKRIPLIKIYRKEGEIARGFYYTGPTSDTVDIIDYIKKQNLMHAEPLNSLQDIIEKQHENTPHYASSLIGFFQSPIKDPSLASLSSSSLSPLHQSFLHLCERLREDIPCGQVGKKSLFKKFGVGDNEEKIILYQGKQQQEIIFDPNEKQEKNNTNNNNNQNDNNNNNNNNNFDSLLDSWIKRNLPSPIFLYSEESSDSIKSSKLPLGKLYLSDKLIKSHRSEAGPLRFYKNRLNRILKEQGKNKLLLMIANKEEKMAKADLQYHKLYDYEEIFVVEHNGKKYVFKDERLAVPSEVEKANNNNNNGKKSKPHLKLKGGGKKTTKKEKPTLNFDDLSLWIDKYLQGDVRPYYRSAPEPKKNYRHGIFSIVGSTFDEFMNGDTSVDRIILFHQNYNDLSKEWAEKLYKKLVQKYFQDNDQFLFGLMDSQDNDWDRSEYPVSTYPSLFIKRAGKSNKKAIAFTEEPKQWTTKSVFKWIQKNAKHKIEKKEDGKKMKNKNENNKNNENNNNNNNNNNEKQKKQEKEQELDD